MADPTPPFISIIIPTYQERQNVALLIRQIRDAMGPRPHEVIVVDDASPDGTADAVDAMGLTPAVRCLRRTGVRSLSGAVIDGWASSKGDLLAVMDADLSHDPALLPRLIEALQAGAAMAVGSRRVPGGGADRWPFHRRLTSSVATWLAGALLNVEIRDPMSGYFALRREVFERARPHLTALGYKILLDVLVSARPAPVVEIPFVFRDRHQGHSKLSGRVMRDYLAMLWRLRRRP